MSFGEIAMARPPKYATKDDKPISVSLRIPRDLHEQAQHHATMRRTTLTELLLEGLRLRLETPTDPRDILVSRDITVMQELEQLIDARVYAVLAAQQVPAPEPAPTHRADEISHYGNAVLQEQCADAQPTPLRDERMQGESHHQPRARGAVRDAVLAALTQRELATAADLAKALGDASKAGIKTVWQALQRLAERGEVIRAGRQYRLAGDGKRQAAKLE
jgi:hypothetical protein